MEDTVTLSKRSTVLSMAAPSVESRARPPAPPERGRAVQRQQRSCRPLQCMAPLKHLAARAQPVGVAATLHPGSTAPL